MGCTVQYFGTCQANCPSRGAARRKVSVTRESNDCPAQKSATAHTPPHTTMSAEISAESTVKYRQFPRFIILKM
jgi:hypothetical protein